MPELELAGRSIPAFDLAVLLGAGVCVSAVLAAVLLNHLAARGAATVEKRVHSPIATASMLAFFVVVLVLLRLRIGAVMLPAGARRGGMLAGLALMAAGALVNVLGRLRLGRNWADQVTVYREQTLVQTGVYGLVRHPLYASLIWMFVGGSLIFRNLAALAATLGVFVPAMVIRARQEELLLAARFPGHEGYRRRVGMLWPRIWPKGSP